MNVDAPGYWPSPWPGEDNGPRRVALARGAPRFESASAVVTSREAIATTMLVLRDPGELFALRHTLGPDVVAWVERIDPVTLETVQRSVDLAAGPFWPGGMAAHADGGLHVVFGNSAHRLDASTLGAVASTELPRNRPYNSFVILPDGTLVTKDFGGARPFGVPAADDPCELLALAPDDLSILARVTLPEPSIARISADGDTVYVVGTSTLWRVVWDGTTLLLDDTFAPRYRTLDGQTYGWDPVLALGAAWFLDDGEGSERYAGTFRDHGTNASPLHLVRVDLVTGDVTLAEICGKPNGLIANPPLVDEARRIVVGYDSSSCVLAAFTVADDGTLARRWQREQAHACHPLLFGESGELVTNDHDGDRMMDAIVVLDIETGEERLRVDSGSAVQSALFPAAGWADDVYYASFAAIARVAPR